MLFICTCKCGYKDDIDNFITLSDVYKIRKIDSEGNEVFVHLMDKTFKCLNCGIEEVTTISMGFSFVEPDGDEI